MGILGATVLMLVLRQPYGAFLNWVRRLFGLPPGGEQGVRVREPGVAQIGGDTVMDGFSRADKALYEAKGSGRNRCVSADYTPPSNVVNLPISGLAERA